MKAKDQEAKIWDGFGTGFWQIMTFLSLILVILGVMTFGFSLLRIVHGHDRWFVWYILCVAGIASITAGIFCMNLFPSWGTIVRRMRLAEARMEGAMSISQINKYEEREDRRSTEIKDQVTESVSKVGRDIKETKDKVEVLQQKLNNIPDNISDLIKSALQNDSSPVMQPDMDSILQDLEKMFSREISNINATVRDMQSQLALQNEMIITSMTKNISQPEPIPAAVVTKQPTPIEEKTSFDSHRKPIPAVEEEKDVLSRVKPPEKIIEFDDDDIPETAEKDYELTDNAEDEPDLEDDDERDGSSYSFDSSTPGSVVGNDAYFN